MVHSAEQYCSAHGFVCHGISGMAIPIQMTVLVGVVVCIVLEEEMRCI